MKQYPKMIYKSGTKHKIGDEYFDDMIVNSEEEEEKFKLEGWESKSSIESVENKEIEAEKARSYEFPKMLYKLGGKLKVAGEFYDYCTVENKEDQEVALEAGWSLRAEIAPVEVVPEKVKLTPAQKAAATRKANKAKLAKESELVEDYDPQF